MAAAAVMAKVATDAKVRTLFQRFHGDSKSVRNSLSDDGGAASIAESAKGFLRRSSIHYAPP